MINYDCEYLRKKQEKIHIPVAPNFSNDLCYESFGKVNFFCTNFENIRKFCEHFKLFGVTEIPIPFKISEFKSIDCVSCLNKRKN